MRKYLTIALALAAVTGCVDKAVLTASEENGKQLISDYVAGFNAVDEELYIQEYDNSEAAQFLNDNVPYFECPDKELEKTYYFRWWTYRKHVKATPEG